MTFPSFPRAVLDGGVELAVRSVLAPPFFAARWLGAADDDGDPSHGSLAGAAKAALDELFLLTEVLSAPLVGRADGERVAREVDAAIAWFDARGWIAAPARYHRRPPRLLAPSVVERVSLAGRRYEHLAFDSRYEPDDGEPGRDRWLALHPNRTAHAWMLRHPGPPRPWLVCLHGYRMGSPLTDFVGFGVRWLHETLGLNVLMPVLPLHGPRTAGRRSGDGALSGDVMDFVHAQAQAAWDVRRLVGWLQAEGAPDVGLYGLSFGACTAALVASLEDPLACVVAGIPLTCFVALARWTLPKFVLAMGERRGVAWAQVERLVRVVSPLAMVPRVPRDRRFVFGAAHDRIVPPRGVRELWWHWGRPRIEWYAGGHVGFGLEPAVRDVVREALAAGGMIPAGA